MNTEQLQCIIRENRCLSTLVKGVYSPDTLPNKVISYPSAYICNTDASYLPGRHWVACWLHTPDRAEFYDSFGLTPEHYDIRFETFMKRNARSYVYNDVCLQQKDSIVCGYHVVYYLLMKCFNVNLTEMIQFLKQTLSPDQFVYTYVSEYFQCI